MFDLLPLCPLGFVSFRTPLAPSPLGALGMGTVRCLNAAAGYLKKRAVAVARTAPRDNGLSELFRFRVRCELQAAIMRGNGLNCC